MYQMTIIPLHRCRSLFHGLSASDRTTIPMMVDGEREINLSIDNDWFSSASGNTDWTGGNVMFQNGKRGQTVSLPGLNGIFSVKEKKLTLDVYNEGQLGLSIHLQRDGWVFLQFKRRLLSLAGFPVGENIDPDSVIFTIEEKIL